MTGLLKVSGQIVTIDHAKRTLLIRSYDDKKIESDTPLKWNPGMDAKMQKNKERYFVTCVYLGETLEDCQYFAKPADWPQQQGNKPGWQGGKPCNEKPIIYQSAFKSCIELVRDTDFTGMSYEQRVEAVRVEAEKISSWMMKGSGI